MPAARASRYFAQTVRDDSELKEVAKAAKAHIPVFSRPFNQLLSRYSRLERPARDLLAEEKLGGHQVTLEGYVRGGAFRLLAITDSVMFPGTISFQRFEYPSQLSQSVQERMTDIAARFVKGAGFDQGVLNMEMFYLTTTRGRCLQPWTRWFVRVGTTSDLPAVRSSWRSAHAARGRSRRSPVAGRPGSNRP